MYCPQCGRELDLDSEKTRFCRYCGFSLLDTKESLQGYSKQKRAGFSVVAWSYALLLLVTLLLHGQYVSLNTGWVYWLLTILIVASVSFFASAAVSALKPALFSKAKPRDKTKSAQVGIESEGRSTSQLPPANVAAMDLSNQVRTREGIKEPRSVVEETTRSFHDRNHS